MVQEIKNNVAKTLCTNLYSSTEKAVSNSKKIAGMIHFSVEKKK
jgi:hypothetical protein